MIYNDILDLIGNTPLVRYSENICLKLEFMNPSGSIKARAAYSMIDEAMNRGEIDKDTVIILYCASGTRSAQAAKTLVDLGYTNIYSLDGGLINWGKPLVTIAED